MLAEGVDERGEVRGEVLELARVVHFELGRARVDDVAFLVRGAEFPADEAADQRNNADYDDLGQAERKEFTVDGAFVVVPDGINGQADEGIDPHEEKGEVKRFCPGRIVCPVFFFRAHVEQSSVGSRLVVWLSNEFEPNISQGKEKIKKKSVILEKRFGKNDSTIDFRASESERNPRKTVHILLRFFAHALVKPLDALYIEATHI